jgi:hypothetical protein
MSCERFERIKLHIEFMLPNLDLKKEKNVRFASIM